MRKSHSLALAVMVSVVLALAGPVAAERLPGADQGGRRLTATLLGANEPGGGDPNARGTAVITLNPGRGVVCWQLQTQGVPAGTQVHAHIHRGPAGSPGPAVLELHGPTGCEELDRTIIRDIMRNPSGYFVNLHYHPFHHGALRGQLER